MATALAKQLQSIRHNVPNPSFQKRRKVPSLLFEPSEAADQDYEQVFALAINGFEELLTYNANLSQFARNIFSEESRQLDRYVQTKEQNSALDIKITSFIRAAAPHFLLRPMQKCLEWLIRRFDVHIHLAEALILTFLPFHLSPCFCRLLAIIELPPSWSFLGAVKKASESPSITLFANSFAARNSLLPIYLTHVQSMMQEQRGFHALISSYADMAVRIISLMRDLSGREDEIFSKFLPTVVDGVKQKKSTEYQVANYMVLTVLSAARTMSVEVYTVTTDALVSGLTSDSQKSGLVCLAQLCQAQDAYAALPSTVYQKLHSMQSTFDRMLVSATKYRCDKLLTNYALSSIESRETEAVEQVKRVLETGHASVQNLLYAISQQVLASAEDQEFRIAIADLIQDLQRQPRFGPHLERFYRSLTTKTDDLELALQMTLVLPASDDKLPKVRRLSSTRSVVDLKDEIAAIPALESGLTYLSAPDVRRTINVLHSATTHGKFEDVIKSPVISRTSDIRLSFLARSALSSNDTATQILALEVLCKDCCSEHKDYQALIPLVIALLSSKSVEVRTAALKLADVLLGQSRLKEKRLIWGLHDLYGVEASKELKWLSSSEASHFLESVVLANRSECILDHKTIYKAVGRGISTHGHKGKELSHRTAALHFLSSHVTASPLMKVVLKLLLCFHKVVEPTSVKTKSLWSLLKNWIKDPEPRNAQCALELLDPVVIKKLLVHQVVPTEHTAIATLIELVEKYDIEFGTIAIEWLEQLFSKIRSDLKAQYFQALIEAITCGPPEFASQASISIDKIDIPADLFLQTITRINISPSSSALSSPVKRQKVDVKIVTPEDSVRRLTHVLEILDRSESRHVVLLPVLFEKLSDLNLVETDSDIPTSYTQQLLLSCMYPLVDPGKFDPKICRIDILVNCIRVSSSPQVHNRALLLVAALAEAAPEQVLHGVMPIFTFMGANILRQDDVFSAHVIESTITRVVPPLLKSMGDKTEDQMLGASSILRSFVDAFPHVPKHRRMRLFVVLVQTLGEDTFLGPLLAIFAHKRIGITIKGKHGESQKSYQEFSLAFIRQFRVAVQLDAIYALTGILRSVRDAADDVTHKDTFLDYSATEVEPLRLGLVDLISGHFASRRVRNEFEECSRGSSIWTDQEIFTKIVESLLQACEELDSSTDARERTFDALDLAITLLPISLFLVVISNLLAPTRDELFRHKALNIVSKRVLSANSDDESIKDGFLTLVAATTDLIDPSSSALIQSAALQCGSNIGRKFGKSSPTTFASAVSATTGYGGLKSSDLVVRVSATEYLTTLVVILGPRILPNLQTFMPDVLDGLSKTSKDEDADLIPLSSISLLEALVKTIPSFMTPHTQIMMQKCADFSFATEELVLEKRSLLSTIATHMPTKNVLEALGGAWEQCSKSGKKPLMALVAVIEETIESSDRKVVTTSSRELLTLFLQALDIRRRSKAWDARGIEQVEKRIIAALIKVVLKLNDSTFRPLFGRLRDWALSELVGKDAAALQSRRIVFFNFLQQFTSTFKSIVLNYFTYVLDDIIELLEVGPDLDVVPRKLWMAIVNSLYHGFASDNEDYWRPADRFGKLAPLLIRHLEYAETYPVQSVLVPAIVELTSAAAAEDTFKTVNTLVLQLFRSDIAAVRLAAVTTENKLSAKLGDEWLTMLPQTIPFIAEAMEDEDERVEKQTHALALTIESFLGESLQKFLK